MSNENKPTDLETLRRLDDAKTKGEWSSKNYRICANVSEPRAFPFAYILDTASNKATRTPQNAANADFITFAANNFRRMIDERETIVADLKSQLAAARESVNKLDEENEAYSKSLAPLDVVRDCVEKAPDGWRKTQCLEALNRISTGMIGIPYWHDPHKNDKQEAQEPNDGAA